MEVRSILPARRHAGLLCFLAMLSSCLASLIWVGFYQTPEMREGGKGIRQSIFPILFQMHRQSSVGLLMIFLELSIISGSV